MQTSLGQSTFCSAVDSIKGKKLPQNWETHPTLGLPAWFDQLVENLETLLFSTAIDTQFERKWIERKNREASSN